MVNGLMKNHRLTKMTLVIILLIGFSVSSAFSQCDKPPRRNYWGKVNWKEYEEWCLGCGGWPDVATTSCNGVSESNVRFTPTGQPFLTANQFINAPLPSKFLLSVVWGGGGAAAMAWAFSADVDKTENAVKGGIAGVAIATYISVNAHTSLGGPGRSWPVPARILAKTVSGAAAGGFIAALEKVPKEMEEEKIIEGVKIGAATGAVDEILFQAGKLIRSSHASENSKNSLGFSTEQSSNRRVRFAFVPFPSGNGKLGWAATARMTW